MRHLRSYYNHKEKRLASFKAYRAFMKGLIEIGPCVECGATKDLHMHHDDYSKPLEVKWMCRNCHMKLHADAAWEKKGDR